VPAASVLGLVPATPAVVSTSPIPDTIASPSSTAHGNLKEQASPERIRCEMTVRAVVIVVVFVKLGFFVTVVTFLIE
jgi:hypothetical protein